MRFEGQLSVFDNRNHSCPCYACLFDGVNDEQDNCSFLGVFAPLVNIIGAMQVAEALKIILNTGDLLIGKLLHYNALNLKFHYIAFDRNPNCRICGI